MDAPLLIFIGLFLAFMGALTWFLRGAIMSLSEAAKGHAAKFALSYVKGGALILIAMGATFEEKFGSLDPDIASQMPWWGWAIMFWKPVASGLAVLVAFLDRSFSNVTKDKE